MDAAKCKFHVPPPPKRKQSRFRKRLEDSAAVSAVKVKNHF